MYLVENAADEGHLLVVSTGCALIGQDDGPITAAVREAVMERQADGLGSEWRAAIFVVNEVILEVSADTSPDSRALWGLLARPFRTSRKSWTARRFSRLNDLGLSRRIQNRIS